MGKHFFDYEDGDFACSISDNIAIDSDGDLLIRTRQREGGFPCRHVPIYRETYFLQRVR